MLQLLRDGPGDRRHVLVLAHGSGTAMDESPMVELAAGVAARGVDVVRFEFPYMQARRAGASKPAPDPDEVLLECFAQVVARVGGAASLVLGGWSRGGRIAAQLAGLAALRIQARALVCLSYPFHPIGQPRELSAVEQLRSLELPTLIVQGSRDAFGNREQVRGYDLGPHVALQWMEDANHALCPRPRSGHTAAQHLRLASDRVAEFVLAQGC